MTPALKMDEKMVWLVLAMTFPIVKCAIPGTFFWRPRLGLDLSIPTTEVSMNINLPSKENIQGGLVVLVDGYQMGLTVVALAAGLSSAKPYPPLNPVSAYFYTNAYRWALRHLSLRLDEFQPPEQAGFRSGYSTVDHIHTVRQIVQKTEEYNQPLCMTFVDYEKAFDSIETCVPLWIGGNGGNYCDTHKVWRRRFFYMDEFVPPWIRKYMLPFVDKNEWHKEENEYKRFKKYAEPAFGKHYRYPSKIFNDFRSQETKESADVPDSSSSST